MDLEYFHSRLYAAIIGAITAVLPHTKYILYRGCYSLSYMFSHKYTVPDYYKSFACKGNACRKTCCKGWGVSLSMREYFRLIGLNCPPKLRKSLDCAFYPAQPQSSERYAFFRKKEDGDCPLHLKSGYCGLQKSCGEGILPAVCRYYPRSPKGGYAYECSCSGSCEKVIELLINRQTPLAFEYATLTFDLDGDAYPTPDAAARDRYQSIRKVCFDLLQNRAYPLPQRLADICRYIASLDTAKKQANTATTLPNLPLGTSPLDDLGLSSFAINSTALGVLGADNCRLDSLAASDGYDSKQAFTLFKSVASILVQDSASLAEYAENITCNFANTTLQDMQQHFEQLYPSWQIMLENILANHLFYDRFPFTTQYLNPTTAYLSLCGVYAFLRYAAMGYTLTNTSIDSLVDIIASASRVIEHSDFECNIASLLKKEGVDTLCKAICLLQI